jgi:hypothetical protein
MEQSEPENPEGILPPTYNDTKMNPNRRGPAALGVLGGIVPTSEWAEAPNPILTRWCMQVCMALQDSRFHPTGVIPSEASSPESRNLV